MSSSDSTIRVVLRREKPHIVFSCGQLSLRSILIHYHCLGVNEVLSVRTLIVFEDLTFVLKLHWEVLLELIKLSLSLLSFLVSVSWL